MPPMKIKARRRKKLKEVCEFTYLTSIDAANHITCTNMNPLIKLKIIRSVALVKIDQLDMGLLHRVGYVSI